MCAFCKRKSARTNTSGDIVKMTRKDTHKNARLWCLLLEKKKKVIVEVILKDILGVFKYAVTAQNEKEGKVFLSEAKRI